MIRQTLFGSKSSQRSGATFPWSRSSSTAPDLPPEAELPPSLTGLAYRNRIDLDLGRDFHHHVDWLIKDIERALQQANIIAPTQKPEPPPPQPNELVTKSIGMTLRLIPAGEFMMGSDATDPAAYNDEFLDIAAGKKEKHRVRITKPFYLGIHEVTRGQFRRFVDDTGYRTNAEKDGKGGYGWNEETKKFEQDPRYTWQNAGFDQTDEHSVVNVSWNDAVAFAQWLSREEGKAFRLPTEAEWEYACRAGTTTRFSCGDDPEGLAAVGNIADGTLKEQYPDWTTIAARDGYVYTAPVGRYNPNAWGLFDMHGNVWEWCSDWYAEDYYKRSPVDDPENTAAASFRVGRGGGWFNLPRDARSAPERERSGPPEQPPGLPPGPRAVWGLSPAGRGRSEPIGKLLAESQRIRLIVFDPHSETIRQWTPQNPIAS